MGMTNEEAIKELEYVKKQTGYADIALDMAIKALEQQPNRCDSCVHSEEQDGSNCYECVKGMTDNFETQPTDADCISRESVYELLAKEDWADTVIGIKELPSVTPQPKTGHWEYVQYDNNPNIGNWHCSECRGICTEMHSIEDAYNYCPNCGAKMEVENEKETC